MEEKKAAIINHIKERLVDLKELGKIYTDEKVNTLASKLVATDRTLEEIKELIDKKFSNEVRKINHNNHLATLKEYYISSIDKLKKGNNCYLLSYEEGVKVLEQANVKEKKDINLFLTQVIINNNNVGYKKANSEDNGAELIVSDMAYLLKIDYAKTYRVFDGDMNPQGIINSINATKKERFLNLEEALRFVKEESPSFTLRTELEDYHDKNIRLGLINAKSTEYKKNIEYVLKLFKALPDITDENISLLKKDYLNLKVFEIFTNSLNNDLTNTGIIVNKETLKYTYRLSPAYNKHITNLSNLKENETICNFFIVDKRELLVTLINNYYKDIKELLSLIYNNKDNLISIVEDVIKEHLGYDEFNKYYDRVKENIEMICDLVKLKKEFTPDSEKDEEKNKDNDEDFLNRIAPYIANYEDIDSDNKGNSLLLGIVTAILFITIGIILLAIIAISKMNI